MSYTAVPTVVAGNVYTPTMYNTYLQNNADSGFMRMLADSTLIASAASFDFTSIPQTFAHLMFVLYARGDAAAVATGVIIRLNNDSAANYDLESISAVGATITAAETFAAASVSLAGIPAASAPATVFGGLKITLPHYAGTANQKTLVQEGSYKGSVAAGGMAIDLRAGYWRSTAAINRITLLPAAGNFVAGTRATLYGLPA